MPYVDLNGETRELTPGDTVVGSGNQAAWRLPSVDLAARHLVFTVGGSTAGGAGVLVRPFAPSALVTVNGRRIDRPTPLADGDLVCAGSAEFTYVADAAAPRQERPRREAWLVDDAEGVAYALQRKVFHLGRDAGSTVQVRDLEVSRYHADVRAEAGLHVLYSLGAAGTKVNGQAVHSTRILDEGDRIEVGPLRLRYTREEPGPNIHVTTGGEDYDLEISQVPTTRMNRIEEGGAFSQVQRSMRHPVMTRFAAVAVGVLLFALVVLIVLLF